MTVADLKYTEEILSNEINREIDALMGKDETLHPQWITHKICRDHVTGLKPLAADATEKERTHVAFWEYGGYTVVRHLTTRCINERFDGPVKKDEPWLPGFDYIQRYYVMRRNGVDVAVRTEDCSDEELLGRASLFRANSQRLLLHAFELERYVDLRKTKTAGL